MVILLYNLYSIYNLPSKKKTFVTGWLLRKHWQVEFGRRWQTNFCQKWYEREDQNEYFATTLFRCPCTLAQAELDKGRFAPDERCNVVDKKCDSRHVGAQHCIRSARPS